MLWDGFRLFFHLGFLSGLFLWTAIRFILWPAQYTDVFNFLKEKKKTKKKKTVFCFFYYVLIEIQNISVNGMGIMASPYECSMVKYRLWSFTLMQILGYHD